VQIDLLHFCGRLTEFPTDAENPCGTQKNIEGPNATPAIPRQTTQS
jgi:hypothetical protein